MRKTFSIFFFIVILFYIAVVLASQFILVKDLRIRIEKNKDDENKIKIYEKSIKLIDLVCLILLLGFIIGMLYYFL